MSLRFVLVIFSTISSSLRLILLLMLMVMVLIQRMILLLGIHVQPTSGVSIESSQHPQISLGYSQPKMLRRLLLLLLLLVMLLLLHQH